MGDRTIVREVIDEINLYSGHPEGFFVEVIGWDSHTRPAAGDYPQATINAQIPDDIDIYLGLMGSHFGTPTKSFGSGTEEEFWMAYEGWKKTGRPEIMFYFSNSMTSLSLIDADQLKRRVEFKELLGQKGIRYEEYEDSTKFRITLQRQITHAIKDVLQASVQEGSTAKIGKLVAEDESIAELQHYTKLLSERPEIAAADLLDLSSEHLNKHSLLQKRLGEEASRFTRNLDKAVKKIDSAQHSQNFAGATAARESIVDALGSYCRFLRNTIPKMKSEFATSITLLQRAAQLIESNSLSAILPISDLQPNLESAAKSFSLFIESVELVSEAFEKWPRDDLEIDMKRSLIVALHKDLRVATTSAIELLELLGQDIAELAEKGKD